MNDLNQTPRASRLHIGIYGRRNSGKSSLINAITGQDIALVSSHAGTTTDPVFKSMELHPIGPVAFIDTAGFDDEGELGEMRVSRTREQIKKTDIAIVIFGEGTDGGLIYDKEAEWIGKLLEDDTPVIPVINKADLLGDTDAIKEAINEQIKTNTENDAGRKKAALISAPVTVSALEKTGIDELREAIMMAVPEDYKRERILGSLVNEGDVALLVMPQDIQAPKGRLILPQVQTIRELLDTKCTTVCTVADGLDAALAALKCAPKLIITDSQCFDLVDKARPEESLLTSFSVLFAAYKGDINVLAEGAKAIDSLTGDSHVLIAEACTHAPLEEDIGRVKIPRILKKKIGEGIHIDHVSGADFPEDLSGYDLVIHCGACMFNRKYMMSRIKEAEAQSVPMTNYGVALAKLTGILDKVTLPE
ncbi:MAG: [Firmicutes bacterium]|nr:[FeFe] hydrogenase H-cluster maturation GTPase HydF [Bacillota bacterium]